MDRSRAAALLALAACIACSSAAPTASNPTALELHDGPSEGCYYNFQHYGEGDRIMTNEPCLNCTCHNRMLMCYLRVCPFTKAIGQDCTVEKRADQCCPIVTCPDVPVDLLTSTSTSSPAEYGTTGVGRLDKYGCSINNKYFPEGSKVPSSPNKPCEHCYCIRNMTTCVMQECTLHVDGCTPIYHKDVCCPVRYSCDHSEDEIPLLDDMTTTVRPTQGFLLTTTTMTPVTQMTQDCIHDEQIFPDGASIKTDKACEHCYCMKGDIVCVVQECGTPMENEGKNCTSLPPRQGQCCPDTYICEGDEPSLDLTTETVDLTSAPPRRVGVEGSGYRNEPDEPYTERGPYEQDIEGSGDTSEADMLTKVTPTIRDELLLITTEKEALYTTEAEKEFNTITDKVTEQEPSVTFEENSFTGSTESILLTSTESKATMADEIIKSDDESKHENNVINTESPLHTYEGDEILPTDISKDKESSPEQSTSLDELSGYTVTETATSIKKEPEIIIDTTDIVAPHDINTTEKPIILSVTEKDNANNDASETNKIDTGSEMTNADEVVTEQNKPDFGYSTVKELNIVDDVTTVSNNKDTAETTSINPVNNEVDYIPGRIPGEGDCLLNGITYNNNTAVPSTNNCHTGCKCISSIIKCDPIICSPPPEYMENMSDCQTSYDSPDACCPTYVCSAKETSLPQSHSQTSVTESSKPVIAAECNGNDCSSSEVKPPLSDSHKICESGDCESGPKQNDCGINGCQGEEQPPLEHPVNCSGDECLVSPTVLCHGDNCEMGPTEDKNVDDKTHSVSPSETICNDADGCDKIKDTSPVQDECNDETCRRKETSETQSIIPAECSGTQCKMDDEQKISLVEPTMAPVTEYILKEKDAEATSGEVETQNTASPVPNIITSEKAITTESITDIGTESATVQVQLPDKTITHVITTEEPIKLDDTVTKIDNLDRIVTAITETPQEENTKSETSPIEIITISDSSTEKIKTSDEASTKQESYTRAPGLDETEAFTESKLVVYTTEHKDTSSQEYTKEITQTTTQKSEAHSDNHETISDESFTKLPTVMDTEKELQTMEIPNFPANEAKVTAEPEDYPMATEKLEAVSATDKELGITLQPTDIQENVKPELPENADKNKDHSEFIPTETQELTTEIIKDSESQDGNKFTTVKSITLQEVSEYSTPVKTDILETVSSESTTPIEIISAEIDKTYTELPQIVQTKSDITVDTDSQTTVRLDESDDQFIEPTTPSSGTKQPEEYSTKVDKTKPGDHHTEIENQEYATTEGKPLVLNDDKPDVELNLAVTEKQTTISLMKQTDENEIEQEIQTKLPKVDKITERTELEMTTESLRETVMTISPFDNEVTNVDFDKQVTIAESDHPYTSNEGPQPVSEVTSKDQLSDATTSATPQDISQTKDVTTAAVLTNEGETEITSSTDKNVNKITSSDESVTETKYVTSSAGGDELTTELPKKTVEEHHPTIYFEKTEIPTETTTAAATALITEEKQDTEEEDKTLKEMTTAVPLFTKEIMDEDISSSGSPDLISQNEDTTDIPSHEEKATTSSVYNTEENKTEKYLEEHLTEESSKEGSSEKPNFNENDFITESPYSQTGSIDSDKHSTIPSEEEKVDQKLELPVPETHDDNKPISTTIPLLGQDDEIITEKLPISSATENESTTQKSEYDVITNKNEQPAVTVSIETNTDNDEYQNHVTEDNLINVVELSPTPQPKTTEISPTSYESETQHTESNTSVQEEDEKRASSEVPKSTTEMQFGSELTNQQEQQTVASVPKDESNTELTSEAIPTSHETTSSSNSGIEIEDVRTTDSVPIIQEDLPIKEKVPVDSIHSSDENYTSATKLDTDIENEFMTTETVPIQNEELPKHPDTASMHTVVPELDTMEEEKGTSEIESATLAHITTESIITSKPSLITSTQLSDIDTTKLTDMSDENQPLSSKIPEPVTSRAETESPTEKEITESATTEKQYVSKSDQEEVPQIPELSDEHSNTQIDIETVTKVEDFGTLTTEKQYVTKSDEDDIPKMPVLGDEQSNSQNDLASVTKQDDIEPFTTEKQYVTKLNEEVPEMPKLPEEQGTDPTYTEIVTKQGESDTFTTERSYETKLEQEVPKPSDQIGEQSTSRTDTESVTKSEDTEPLVTEKQYVTNLDQEEVPKAPILTDEQSTSQTDAEGITALNDIEPYTTEKQYVTESNKEEVPKLPEPSEEQGTVQSDTEILTKPDDSEYITTEKQYVSKSDQEEVPKIPEPSEEQGTVQPDTEIVSKQDDSGSMTTEKQYVTKTDQEEVPKIPEPSGEQSTVQSDTELVSKQDDSESTTTEKQYVTKSSQEDIPKIPVLIGEQSTSQNDIESVTKVDDIEPFVTEKQYITSSDEKEIPKIPVSFDGESTSQSDMDSTTKLNDIEPYTTEKQYVTKSNEESPETPDLPKEQTTDRTDIEEVSKTEDSGASTTERLYVTKLEQEVSETPAPIDDQSTSRYDSESVTKLEDTEPTVTEKEYVSNPEQEEPSKFPVVPEEQSTSRIDIESVTKLEDSGTDHEDTSHKLDTDISKPEQDSEDSEKTTSEPLSYPETTIKSELGGLDLFKPSEDVTEVPQKEDSTEILPTDLFVSTSIPEKVETPSKTDNENVHDFERDSTEKSVQTSLPADETVTIEKETDIKPYESEHKTPSKPTDEGFYSETTPYSVLLEEHTHPALEGTSSSIPIDEGTTTTRTEVLPERGDEIPDTPHINDEYERTTAKQMEEEITTSYEKISSPIVQSGDDAATTSIEKVTSETIIQDEDKKYSPSMENEGLTTPIVLPTIKDKEQHITPPTILDSEKTTIRDIVVSSEEPELTTSSGKDTQELSPSSTSKLQEEAITQLPPSEDKYKEKPLIPSPSPSSSETPDILGEPHEEEHLPDFPTSGAGAGYGQEPDYVEEDQAFGPGTCRYGGKVYVSAQQIPRDDPCDFCFCFRSDIICLQQSCPPPIHGCHEEPIQGFCCPRYECPVSMATTVNVTTTTTTTTTTLPPHFLPHAYKGAAQRRGCQIKGHSYKVGEVVRASSGPCLHCTCGGDGQMKCDPKACTPEPMLRQMIAAAVSAKRRR